MPDDEWLEYQRELHEQREREEEEHRLLEEEYRQQEAWGESSVGPGPSRSAAAPASIGPPAPQGRNPLSRLLQGCGCVSQFGFLIAVVIVVLLGLALALIPMDDLLGRDNPCETDTLLACAQGVYADVAEIFS